MILLLYCGARGALCPARYPRIYDALAYSRRRCSSRKQYRASSSTKSEYSLRTVAEQLDNNEAGPAPQVLGRSRMNGTNAAGSTYSLRKPLDPEPVDDGESEPLALHLAILPSLRLPRPL